MNKYRFLVASSLSWLVGVLLACTVTVVMAGHQDDAQVLRQVARAYVAGDLDGFVKHFAPGGAHGSGTFSEDIPGYAKLLAAPHSRRLELRDISIRPDGSGAAWLLVRASEPCSGLAEWQMNGGIIQSWSYECYGDGSELDGAFVGQAADVATTAAALAQGATELNPIVAGAPAIVLPAKLLLSYGAESLESPTCRAVKDTLAGFGMGAGVWNVGVIAGAAPLVGAALGIAAGVMWHLETEAFHAAACRKSDDIQYALIDGQQIVAR